MLIYFLCVLAQSHMLTETLILSSESTPQLLLKSISPYPSYYTIYPNSTFESTQSDLSAISFSLLLDLTLQPSFYPLLNQLSEAFNVAYLTLSNPSALSFSQRRFHLHRSPKGESAALIKIMSHLNWKEFTVISSADYSSFLLASEIHSSSPLLNRFFSYDPDLSQRVSDSLIGKLIKAKGIRNLLLIGDGHSLKILQSSIISKKLDTAGTQILMSSSTIYSSFVPGALVLVESGLEAATNRIEYDIIAISNSLNALNEASNGFKVDSSSLLSYLSSTYPDFSMVESYTLINLYNGTKISVGVLKETFAQFNKIIFPGNITDPELHPDTTLVISIANGIHEIYNISTYSLFNYWYSGAVYACNHSNEINEIPGFKISLKPTDCSIYLYDANWYSSCLSKSAPFGLAYLTNIWFTSATGTLLTLRTLNISIPQISPISQDSSVDDNKIFPEFLKLSVSANEYFSNGFIFQRSLGWDYMNVIATDDIVFYSQYKDIVRYAQAIGIKILNPEDKRILPANYSREDYGKYKDYFQAAKENGCNVFIVLAWDRGLIWEALYDVGLRRGEYFNVGETATLTYLNEDIKSEYKKKREELLEGSIIVTYNEWNSDLGAILKRNLSELYQDVSYMCQTYDTFMVVKEALKYMITKGDDYDNSTLLGYIMRTSKINGCLGTTFFDRESNSRAFAQFRIQQARKNESTHIWYGADIAVLDHLSSQMITILNKPIWPFGNLTTPSNFRAHNPCPFDAYQIIDSTTGSILLAAICLFFLGFSILFANISRRSFRNEFKLLTDRKIMTFADMVFFGYFFMQCFQLISLGPTQDALTQVAHEFELMLSMDFSGFFHLFFSKFWILYYVATTFCVVWVLVCLVVVCRCDRWCGRCWVFDKIWFLSQLVLPVLGHICFLPIFSMLLSIFDCKKAIGDRLIDSYLKDDCNTFCYQNDHLLYSLISFGVILFYLSSAIYCRPLWEFTQFSLNIHTKASYLSLLSVYQILAVIISKNLKDEYESINGYLLSSLTLLIITATIYLKPYSYQRATVLQCLSLSVSFWGIFSATVFKEYFSVEVWLVLELSGFAFIIILSGLVLLRLPALIFTEKGLEISALFLFQFDRIVHEDNPQDRSQRLSKYTFDKIIATEATAK